MPKLHRDGGDLDLLVADEHVEKVTSKIRSFSNKITDQFADSIPIGMHAISSAAGIPYYPPQLATGVLERSGAPAHSSRPTSPHTQQMQCPWCFSHHHCIINVHIYARTRRLQVSLSLSHFISYIYIYMQSCHWAAARTYIRICLMAPYFPKTS